MHHLSLCGSGWKNDTQDCNVGINVFICVQMLNTLDKSRWNNTDAFRNVATCFCNNLHYTHFFYIFKSEAKISRKLKISTSLPRLSSSEKAAYYNTYLCFLVRRRPLVAVGIITAAKEEVGEKHPLSPENPEVWKSTGKLHHVDDLP